MTVKHQDGTVHSSPIMIIDNGNARIALSANGNNSIDVFFVVDDTIDTITISNKPIFTIYE